MGSKGNTRALRSSDTKTLVQDLTFGAHCVVVVILGDVRTEPYQHENENHDTSLTETRNTAHSCET